MRVPVALRTIGDDVVRALLIYIVAAATQIKHCQIPRGSHNKLIQSPHMESAMLSYLS